MASSVNLLRTAAFAALERLIEGALRYDPATRSALADLHGQVFALHCTEPEFLVYVVVDDPPRICERYDGEATTTIVGKASEFAELFTAEDPTSTLINSDIKLKGSSAPLIELQKIVRHLEIDWEEPLADIVGDAAAYRIGQSLRELGRWGAKVPKSLARQVEEFIFEEARLTPSRLEYDDFVDDLANLHNGIERAKAKLDRLIARAAAARGDA